ncbi:MAG: hypothetical protein KGD64_07145 [Candidatus Heimdallarchaeota archaeon]|nr:hypothetical protein [Candidatus Heimdallarchaeota archaeon]
MEYRMVFDAGSTALKCAIADENNTILAVESIIPKIISSEDGFGRQWESGNYWENLLNLAELTIKKAKIDSQKIKCLTSTAIRPSSVFTDEDFNPLYISASFDIRGIDYGDEIDERVIELTGKSLYQYTGHFPNLLMIPGRFEWLRNNPEAVHGRKIEHYLPVDSWILVKLGGEFHTNTTSAMESGFFDIKEKAWLEEWHTIFEIDDSFFPPPVDSGEIIGHPSKFVQEKLNLDSEVEIVAGIPDTQAALLAANAITPGNIGVVLGSTTPVQTVMDKLRIGPEVQFWIGGINIKNICDNYLVEASTGMTGHVVRWAANMFGNGKSKDQRNISKEQFENLKYKFDKFDKVEQNKHEDNLASHAVYGNLGPLPLATTSSDSLKGEFHFPSPGGVEEYFINQEELVGAVFDNITFAVAKNIEYTKEFAELSQSSVYILGGISRYELLCQRIADVLNAPISHLHHHEASLHGILLLCDVASGKIKNMKDLSDKIEEQKMVHKIEPRPEMVNKLQQKYKKWLSIIKPNLKI